MRNFNEIVQDAKITIYNLYGKPLEGYNNEGLKGGIKGLGSGLGSLIEKSFELGVDSSCLIYEEVSKMVIKKEEPKNAKKEKSYFDSDSDEN